MIESWKLEPIVACSFEFVEEREREREREYMVADSASCEAIWLCKLIAKLIDQMLEPIVVGSFGFVGEREYMVVGSASCEAI
jgi:hypothetical protein